MSINTRDEYRTALEQLDAGAPVSDELYDEMVAFAKEKKMKRPVRPTVQGDPAPASEPAQKPAAKKREGLSRKECVARLKELGYDGPTSYLMPALRSIVQEQEKAKAKAAASK